MSVTPISETREFRRNLEYSRENALPGIFDNSKDKKPLVSVMTGQLATPMFGGVGNQGQGKRVSGGESIVLKLRVATNSTVGSLTGGYSTFDTTPQSNVIHGRASWKLYGGTVSLSKHEINSNAGGFGHVDIVQDEMRAGAEDLVDDISGDLYDNGGVTTNTSGLDDIISVNDSIYGVSGATYPRWNSRGVSARGTAAASVSFASGSFAGQGIQDMRVAWNNCTEGTESPQGIFTTHDVMSFYEGALQPQERFNSPRMADGGFQFLQFKSAPMFPDPDCQSGAMYFLNFNHLYLQVQAGADFSSGEFIEPVNQRVLVSKLFATCELVCDSRLLQNKLTGITA